MKRKMKLAWRTGASIVALLLSTNGAQGQVSVERDTNRQGMDYKNFKTAGQPEECRQACANDQNCQAYTWVPLAESEGLCWLKNGVPQPTAHGTWISGVKSISASQVSVERDTNRQGMDYKNFETGRPEDCGQACANDQNCQAYTWVPLAESQGLCWLKNGVPQPTAHSTWISGVKSIGTMQGQLSEVAPSYRPSPAAAPSCGAGGQACCPGDRCNKGACVANQCRIFYVESGHSYYEAVWGMAGGEDFAANCWDNEVAVGFQGRAAKYVDAIDLLCSELNWDGSIAPVVRGARGRPTGGQGGVAFRGICPPGQLLVGIFGSAGEYVDQIGGQCSTPTGETGSSIGPWGGGGGLPFAAACRKGFVMPRIGGKSGEFIDMITFGCMRLSIKPD